MTRRQMLLATAVTAAVGGAAASGLTGCSSPGTGNSASQISFWGAFSSTDTRKQFQSQYIDSFNSSTKTGQVKMEVKQLATLGSLVDTAVSAGSGPDVVYTSGPSSALALASAKRIDNLDDAAAKYGWKDKLQPWAYQASLVGGHLTSVPISYGSIVLYYNPGVFKQHGWQVPKTAAEFASVAQKAKDDGMIPVGAGNSGYKAESEWYLSAVLNAAVGPQKLYETLTGKAKFTDPEFVSALTTFKQQIDKGWWGGGRDRWFTNTDTDMFTGLASGKVAMYMTGTWSFGSSSTFFGPKAGNNEDWDWAPLPSLSDSVQPGVYPLAIGTNYGVSSASKNKDGAAAFIDSFVDPAKAYGYMAKTGENPPPLSDVSSIPSSIDERTSRLFTGVPKAANLGYASWTFFPPATDAYLSTEFDKVITGDLSPTDYLAGLQKTFDGEFAAGKVPTPFKPGSSK